MTVTALTYAFFLGGADLEMREIVALLRRLQMGGDNRISTIHDAGLAWGAKASVYRDEIEQALNAGLQPVLIELSEDIALPGNVVLIDHHGKRSTEPSALAQVFALLCLPDRFWTRRMALVDANDRGHIAAMQAMGATPEEIRAIRAEDRRAQGITATEEAEGLAALSNRREALSDTLVLVDLPHGRTATVADPLTLAGDTRDLVIFCPKSTEFFGSGKHIARLDHMFPGGWRGGQLPRRGFWGISRPISTKEILIALS